MGLWRWDLSAVLHAQDRGQEDYVYVWTRGAEGLGDGQDKLVTVDANPASNGYGTVAHMVSVGGRNEAHHGGFTDDGDRPTVHARGYWISTIAKSDLGAPQSGHTQVSGISAQRVPGAMPASGKPWASS
jgi:hypothetical protein